MRRACTLLTAIAVLVMIGLPVFASGTGEGAEAEPTVLRLSIFDCGNTPGDFLTDGAPAQFVQEAFGDANNTTIEWVAIPRSEETSKLNVMMAAEDAPDLCFTYSAGTWQEYARQGGLAALDEYIDENGANLTAWLGDEVLSWGVYGGEQITIPGKRNIREILGTWIRQDWLDALGLPVPTTREEYIDTLRAFRDEDPGNVGENLAPMGFGPIRQVQFWLNLFYSFQFNDGLPTERERAARVGWNDLAVDGSKDGVRFLNTLHNEGLLQQDWALAADQREFESALANGYLGAFSGNRMYPWFYNIMPAIKENAPESYWVPIDPFQNNVGDTPKLYWTPTGIHNFVPIFSDNAELVVKYLDWMSVEDNLVKLMYGEEGVHYDRNPDGIILPQPLSGDDVWEFNILDRAVVLNGSPYTDQEQVYKAAVLPYVDEQYTEELFIRHHEYMARSGVVDVYIEKPPESLVRKGPVLGEKIQEVMTRAIMAAPEDFDRVYDAGYEELVDLGLLDVRADLLDAYDSQQ